MILDKLGFGNIIKNIEMEMIHEKELFLRKLPFF